MDKEVFDTTRRGFLKTLAIGAGGCALGSGMLLPGNALAESLTGNLAKVPVETRWAISSGGLVKNQLFNFKNLLDGVGREKFIEIISKKSFFVGGQSAALAKKLGFTGNDAESCGATIAAMVTIFFGPGQKFTFENVSKEKVKVKCTNCAFWNTVQGLKITEDLCSTNSKAYWNGFAQALNPKLTSPLVKARPLGDSVCEWAIELKA